MLYESLNKMNHTTGPLRVWSYSFRRLGGWTWKKCPV